MLRMTFFPLRRGGLRLFILLMGRIVPKRKTGVTIERKDNCPHEVFEKLEKDGD